MKLSHLYLLCSLSIASMAPAITVEAEKSNDDSMVLVQDEQGKHTVYVQSDAKPETDVVVHGGQVYKKVDQANKKYTIIYQDKAFMCGLLCSIVGIVGCYGLGKFTQFEADHSSSLAQALFESGPLTREQVFQHQYFLSNARHSQLFSYFFKTMSFIGTMVLGAQIAEGTPAVVVKNDNKTAKN